MTISPTPGEVVIFIIRVIKSDKDPQQSLSVLICNSKRNDFSLTKHLQITTISQLTID